MKIGLLKWAANLGLAFSPALSTIGGYATPMLSSGNAGGSSVSAGTIDSVETEPAPLPD